MIRLLLGLLLVVGSYCMGFAQFRQYSNEFLNIGAGARGLAMGGAQVATVNDVTAGYWNPAALANIQDHPSVGFMHADYFSGIGKYDFLAAAFPLAGGKKALGITALRFGVDDIPNTLFLVEPDNSINYNNIRTFSSADYAFLLSYAQTSREDDDNFLRVGGSTKIIYRNVGSFAKAWGFGFDVGVQMKRNTWYFGATLRDATTTFNAWRFTFTDRERQQLYLTNNDIPIRSNELTAPRLVLAAAKELPINDKFSALVELNTDLTFGGKRNTLIKSNAVNIDPRIGLELNYNKTVFVRAGVQNFQQALADSDTLNQKKVWIFQPSVGAGFKAGNVHIDYAFSNLANQSNPLFTHIFSIRLDIRKKD